MRRKRPERRLLPRLGLVFGTAALLAGCGGPEAVSGANTVKDCRRVTLVDPAGNRVVGVEDIAVDRRRGLAYFSAYDRRGREDASIAQGGIYGAPALTLMSGSRISVTDIAADLQLKPHGIALLPRADGPDLLFAINRADGPAIETLALSENGRAAERSAPPLAFAALCRPNDLAAVSAEKLFVSNDTGACGGLRGALEVMLGSPGAFVAEVTPQGMTRAIENIAFANGLALAPGRGLAVAATRSQEALIYALGPAAALQSPPRRIALDHAPDNLAAAPDGTLYAAALPSLLRYALFRSGWENRAQSAVWRLPADGGAPERIFADDGRLLSGATVAVPMGSLLLIGSAYEDAIAVCRLPNQEGRR